MSDTKPLTPEVRAVRKANMRSCHAPTWLKSRKWAWFWEVLLSDMNSTEKLTAIALWAFANASFCPVFPSIANLATIVGVTERQMKTLVARIEECGFVKRRIGGGRLSTRYEFTLTADVLNNNLTNANSPLWDDTDEAGFTGQNADDPTGEAHFTRTNETYYLSNENHSAHVAAAIAEIGYPDGVLDEVLAKNPQPHLEKVSAGIATENTVRGKCPDVQHLGNRHEDVPSLSYRYRQFIELGKRVLKVDKNHILSEYLWYKKGFQAFVRIVDEGDYDEFSELVVGVANRESMRCNKRPGSIKTWSYFKKAVEF